MTRFDSVIARAGTDLGHVQSALDTAQQAVEVADRTHRVGRRVLRMVRTVALIFAIGAAVIGVVVLVERLWRGFRPGGDEETTDAADSSLTGNEPVGPARTSGKDHAEAE
jgi:hypothetical protein